MSSTEKTDPCPANGQDPTEAEVREELEKLEAAVESIRAKVDGPPRIEDRGDELVVRRQPWMTDRYWNRIVESLMDRGWTRG